MGACCSGKQKAYSPQEWRKNLIQAPEIKAQPSVESITANDQLLQRMRQVSSFKCQVVTAMTLHNHLVYVRECMKAQEILIFNIGHTSQLEVAENQIAQIGAKEEQRKSEDFMMLDDALSNQTITE